MKRASRPFPLEKARNTPWGGVHTPDPLRDDPEHPHASLGSDNHKNKFADGGMITDSASYMDPTPKLGARRPATNQAAPAVMPLPAPANANSRSRRRFKYGGKVHAK